MEKVFSHSQDILLADLETLISGSLLVVNNVYHVTDKDWWLRAVTTSVLKPVSGSLHIFNGETLPTGVEPDVLLIDTGIIDYDISTETGSPITVYNPLGYTQAHGVLECLTYTSGVTSISYRGANLFNETTEIGIYPPWYDWVTVSPFTQNYELSATGVSPNDSIRVIIEFWRSELSTLIPVPHIVSAETNEDGTYIIISTNNVLPSGQSPVSAILKKNSIVISNDEILVGDVGHEMEITWSHGSTPFINGDIITFSLSGNIKNIWGGLLEAVTDYPVVNNVPLIP